MKYLVLLAATLLSAGIVRAQDWTTIHDFNWTCTGVMLTSETEGWACNAVYSGTPLQAKYTTDGGDNWTGQDTGLPSGSAGNMRDVASPDSSDIFMIGNEGNLIRNGGDITWDIVNLGVTVPLRTIQFASASVGYIGADGGNFFKTTDGGDNWSNLGFPNDESVNSMYFLSEMDGFAYTYGAGIYRTYDGAQNWTYIPFDEPISVFSNGIRDMCFVNDNLGFAVGTNEVIMKTTDGGDNWSFIPSGSTSTLQAVDFANETRGFACGWNGTILGTTDGGESWFSMTHDAPETELLHEIDFYDNYGLLTSNSGYVLFYELPSAVTGCTDPTACNYDPLATEDDGSCIDLGLGCTDPTACNFDPLAVTDNGYCHYMCYGCINDAACNYDPNATFDDGNCDYSCWGCTYPTAPNYNPDATRDDGSCDFDCLGDFDGDGIVGTLDLLDFLSVFGVVCD